MSNGQSLDDLEAELDAILKKNHEAFEGKYKKQIEGLLGLSREEIDKLTPDTTDIETYDKLIVVVKNASQRDMAIADLRNRIKKMGSLAMKIAKRIPGLL
ncbi:MAG: hypothetical protein OEP48_14880 [Betaproteobacteria bacterium]|nr:hypothetical protein [Betaproteobacteria bacterium]MDH3437012.1 hypothetical protein [Betaproteobacteria bacterium]